VWCASQLIIQKNSIIGNTCDLSTSLQSCVMFFKENIIVNFLSPTNPNVISRLTVRKNKINGKKMKFMSNFFVTKFRDKIWERFHVFLTNFFFLLCPICKPISSISNMKPLQLYNIGSIKFREKWCSRRGSNFIYECNCVIN